MTVDTCQLIPKDENIIKLKYLYYYLKSNEDNIKKMKTGTGSPGIKTLQFKQSEIKVPSIEMQNKILNFIDSLYSSFNEIINKIKYLSDNYNNN